MIVFIGKIVFPQTNPNLVQTDFPSIFSQTIGSVMYIWAKSLKYNV